MEYPTSHRIRGPAGSDSGTRSPCAAAAWLTDFPWLAGLLDRRPVNITTVALANKNARIVWAMMVRGESFRHSANAVAA